MAYRVDQHYHGTPSGIDNTVIAYAQPVFFIRGQPFERLCVGQPFTVVIGNTGGLGAVLRADPVTGSPVAALRDQQVLDVLERRNVPGSGDWVHVRTADGKEGWVTGIVARPLPTASN